MGLIETLELLVKLSTFCDPLYTVLKLIICHLSTAMSSGVIVYDSPLIRIFIKSLVPHIKHTVVF